MMTPSFHASARLLLTVWLVVLLSLALGARAGTTPSTAGMPKQLAATAVAAPAIDLQIPEAGATVRELTLCEIAFDQPGLGVEAADLLIDGQSATNVVEIAPGHFIFSFSQPPDGIVAVTCRANHGITDSTGARLFEPVPWTCTLDSVGPAPGVVISEFMADNSRTLHDEDGDSSDWIEIYNPGETAAPLEGWSLTDDPLNLQKWRFPKVAVPANGFLVVFASEKDRTNATGRLHTNFRLSIDGEYLALVAPGGWVMSEFAPSYPKQLTDVSYGGAQGAPELTGYFTKPTPGAANSQSGAGFAPEVEFSSLSGTFSTPFLLSLSSSSTNAIIRYTLDGTAPTNTSLAYTQPIAINTSVQVRARAFESGLFPGPPRSESYLLLSGAILNFGSDLPVMVIDTFGKAAISSSRASFVHVSVYEPVNGRTSLTDPPSMSTRAGIRIRGSSTEGLAKSSYALEFWDEFNRDTQLPILGLPAESDWVLYAPNIYEPVLIHNPFVHQLSRDLGMYSPRTRFLEVYVAKNSGAVTTTHYVGIYVLEEKIKIGKNRVDIAKLEPENNLPPAVTGGYLLKIDRLDPSDSGLSAGGALMGYVDPKEPEIRLAQRDPQEQYIKTYFNSFATALAGANWRNPTLGYPAYIDVTSWIDFHVLEVLSGNVDTLVLSTYFHKPRNGKIVFGPHWDFDRALGSTDGRDANPRVWQTGPFFSPPWWNKLFTDSDFWQRWVDRWQELRTTHFSLANLHGLIDRLTSEVRQAQPREFQKWHVALRGGSYQTEINAMKNWLSNRIDFIDKQLAQPPHFSALGGTVPAGFSLTLTAATNAAIYYTLSGVDPRASQGGFSASARLYSGPITISASTRVIARTRDLSKRQVGGPPTASSTTWSGPVSATFLVAPLSLIPTEIMFHPAPPPAGSTNTIGDFEFVEVMNSGREAVSLIGLRFTNGIDFTFTATSGVTRLQPGERALVVRNQEAFRARYPGVTGVAGAFSGSLKNDHQRLTLLGPVMETIFDVTYNQDWARLTDGFGFSLVLQNETTTADQLADGSRWRASAGLGGSPGEPDPAPQPVPTIYVNEVVTNPAPGAEDAVELFNPLEVSVDISGWWLTDDFRQPKKFHLPTGTVIGAHGFAVIQGKQFRYGALGFGLSASGDEVYLFSANAAGDLTGWVHGFQFGAQEPGTSFSRCVTTDEHDHLAPSTSPSPGNPNPNPEAHEVVVSEIMYHPPSSSGVSDTMTEFIELTDIGPASEPTAMFDLSHPTNTWRLRGEVEFDFPPGFRMPASRRLVVTGFDPDRDPYNLAGFRARYRLQEDVPILGPWRGSLSGAGGTVRLLKPLAPVTAPASDAGVVPYALVEEVPFLPVAPWPENVSGTGQSLARRSLMGFAPEPTNWIGLNPTPGDVDTDGDGMPDRWEIANGLDPLDPSGQDGPDGDLDGDGYTNWQEYVADTDAHDAESALKFDSVTLTASNVELIFTARVGRTYTVLYRETLSATGWLLLRTVSGVSADGPLRIIDPRTTKGRFYRLQAP